MELSNRNNFIRWYNLNVDLSEVASALSNQYSYSDNVTVKYGNEKQFDFIKPYSVILLDGEKFACYANLDNEETTSYAWQVNLVDENYNIQAYNVLDITYVGNRFYIEGVLDTTLNGCYHLSVMVGNTVIYFSNLVYVGSLGFAQNTLKIRYRNPINILNFDYEGLPSFKNEFRIKMVKRKPKYPVNRIGYDLVNGSFNPVRTTKGLEYEFITMMYSELDHEAFNAASIQSLEIYNQDFDTWESFRRTDSGSYEVEWESNGFPLADGNINLEQLNAYSSNKNL